VTMRLGAIYEEDFHEFSHGFRPGHSAHQALSELREQCREQRINWIVDADVSGFFDSLDHGLLRELHMRAPRTTVDEKLWPSGWERPHRMSGSVRCCEPVREFDVSARRHHRLLPAVRAEHA
jgi:hypothetical protein